MYRLAQAGVRLVLIDEIHRLNPHTSTGAETADLSKNFSERIGPRLGAIIDGSERITKASLEAIQLDHLAEEHYRPRTNHPTRKRPGR
ncbi:hypothetical protein [Streptomyces sp. MC1]|uniref:hypothetical protein n=1 Tax=Streptomyces sp. MC1 TaxID=295105 RepID=UPI0027DB6F64|nr:hypothetical protein [Streptomyces sp. MC1]